MSHMISRLKPYDMISRLGMGLGYGKSPTSKSTRQPLFQKGENDISDDHHNLVQGSKYRISESYLMGFFISDIRGDIGDTRAYRAFILNTIYN